MNLRNRVLFPLFIVLLAVGSMVFAEESDMVKSFKEAIQSGDTKNMRSIVEENRENVPAEVDNLLNLSLSDTSTEERDSKLYIAETMAKVYKDVSGDVEPLRKAKKIIFDTKLSGRIRSVKSAEGVHIVEMPEASEGIKDIFKPDNIVIKKGETVRWVNKDKVAHVFASMPFIGMGGIFTPPIEPGSSWEYTFEKPGEYFYMCFIHRGMVGKATVEE